MPSFLDSLKNISVNLSSLIDTIFIVISLSILIVVFMMIGTSRLSVKEKIPKIQKMVDDDPSKFRLTRILLGQYLINLDHGRSNKTPYNGFVPYSWLGNVDIHLSHTQQIQFAMILDRDLATARRRDFVIDSGIGSIKWTRSGTFITVDATLIQLVAKAEIMKNVPVTP